MVTIRYFLCTRKKAFWGKKASNNSILTFDRSKKCTESCYNVTKIIIEILLKLLCKYLKSYIILDLYYSIRIGSRIIYKDFFTKCREQDKKVDSGILNM
jgi:hypothetical protein